MMKKIFLITAAVVAVSLALAQTSGTGDCSCASCEAKASGTFTLAGLEGLNAQPEEQAEHEEVAHDHDGDGVADHDSHEDHDDDEGHGHDRAEEPEACCPHDEEQHDHSVQPKATTIAHDHDGDGVADHGSHDDHAEDAHAEDAHAGCSHDYGTVDPHAGHDHGAEGEGGVELSEAMQQKVGIKIQEARGGSVSRTSVFPAEIKLNLDRTASVSPRYASIVRQVFAEIGDEVRKGDILASLENRETMAVYSVSAPQDGVIITKNLAVGETASEDRVLYQVADLSSVWADISIFPQYQHRLRKGMEAELIAHDGHKAKGTIKYISPIVSEQTRTFTARCILEGALDDFTPGVFVRARITVESVDAMVVVPRGAVQSLEGEDVVFIPKGDGFVSAPVRLGLADDQNAEIKSGLKPGDPFVAAGAFALKAQMVTSGMDPHAGHGH